jgi:two-component system OmpR family response regulator
MSDLDILSDEEREAINEAMQAPDVPAKQRVLIVDDDKDTREVLAELLSLNGISCLTAASGSTALKLLESRKAIGLLITDLNMAPCSGLDLIRHVRESERAALPIIIISGEADVEDAIAAMHLNVVDFLLKPIDTKHLVELITRELGDGVMRCGVVCQVHRVRPFAGKPAPTGLCLAQVLRLTRTCGSGLVREGRVSITARF